MESLKSKRIYNLDETIAKGLLKQNEYPWDCLTKIQDFILDLGDKLDKEKFEQKGENIWIAKNANISKLAVIEGPTIIDENAEIRPFAYIRGRVIIGKNVIVGNSSEIKNSILFNEAKVPHYNYVGDSILGYNSHMGAGSITSNVKSDNTEICIKFHDNKIETGLRKMGLMLGDNSEIGCNAVLNPGTVIGKNTTIYPLCSVRGFIPENHIYKDKENLVEKI